jgi:predicted Zn-dependent protease
MNHTDHQKKQFAIAQERSRLNDLPGTIEILKSLVAENPTSAIFNATYANVLKENGDLGLALEHFRKAVSLAPKSERYSLGLFHLLWGQGRRDEALDETKRFMSVSDSDEYRKIVAAINAHWPHEVPVAKIIGS